MSNVFPTSDIKQHIREITEADIAAWNLGGDGSPSTIMRTIQISEYNLVTNDTEGVQQYMLQQGIVINKGEIILIKVDKISTYMVSGYVEAGYVF